MEVAFKKIEKRRWDIISERWRDYLPDDLRGMPDAFEPLMGHDPIVERMRNIDANDIFRSIDDAPIIRTLIFEAARFNTERCLYCTRFSEQLAATRGAPTAAIALSYLGLLFGSRALQGLLGLYYCFFENQTWLFDIWPGVSNTSGQGQLLAWSPKIIALISKQRIGHELHWKLFIRLRQITTRIPLDHGPLSILNRLRDHGSFSRQRNGIQYNDRWPYPDLYGWEGPTIGLLPVGWNVREADFDHNLKVSQIIAFCCAHMLLDILSPLPKFREYCLALKGRLGEEWHPLLNAGALSTDIALLKP